MGEKKAEDRVIQCRVVDHNARLEDGWESAQKLTADKNNTRFLCANNSP